MLAEHMDEIRGELDNAEQWDLLASFSNELLADKPRKAKDIKRLRSEWHVVVDSLDLDANWKSLLNEWIKAEFDRLKEGRPGPTRKRAESAANIRRKREELDDKLAQLEEERCRVEEKAQRGIDEILEELTEREKALTERDKILRELIGAVSVCKTAIRKVYVSYPFTSEEAKQRLFAAVCRTVEVAMAEGETVMGGIFGDCNILVIQCSDGTWVAVVFRKEDIKAMLTQTPVKIGKTLAKLLDQVNCAHWNNALTPEDAGMPRIPQLAIRTSGH